LRVWPCISLLLTAVAAFSLLLDPNCVGLIALLELAIIGACNVADGQRRLLDWATLCVPLMVWLALAAGVAWLLLSHHAWA
jgi:hypothetical protein